MKLSPKYIQTQNIIDEIDRLIIDDGYSSFGNLPDYAQNKLTAYSMDALGRDVHECIVESEDFNGVLGELRNYLINEFPENAIDLANHLRNNTRDYFFGSLSALFDERYSILGAERKRDSGLRAIVDSATGDIRWIR